MFGMPQMAAAPPPYVAPAPAPPPPQAAPSAIARSFYSGSMRRSPTMPHHPGRPSIEPHVYDDGRPATVDGRLESEKARWFKKARNGINPSAVAPSLLEPNAAPTIGHSVWEGEPDGRSEDGLTSVSRRGREPPKPKKSIPETRRSGSRGGLSRGIAKAASLSKPERHRSRMAGAPAFSDYSGARSGGTRRYARPVTLSESDIAGGSAPASAVSSNYERATRSRGNAPATAFSLSESDLGGASAQSLSWRGASNDGSGMRTLAGSTLVSGLKPRHRRIDSLVRSEAQSRRTRG